MRMKRYRNSVISLSGGILDRWVDEDGHPAPSNTTLYELDSMERIRPWWYELVWVAGSVILAVTCLSLGYWAHS